MLELYTKANTQLYPAKMRLSKCPHILSSVCNRVAQGSIHAGFSRYQSIVTSVVHSHYRTKWILSTYVCINTLLLNYNRFLYIYILLY